ncbi:uncharacterized protein JCM10292_000513 [Rhodotorula paludigena]|uniref:uncharacterized protein n=1 Tax=Rhodotorula paludigena TaxID=86838 RepID=UPI0031734442
MRSPFARLALVALFVVLAVQLGVLLRTGLSHRPPGRRARRAPDADEGDDSSARSLDVQRVEPGATLSFRTYLDAVLLPASNVTSVGQLWLTAASSHTLSTWTPILAERVARLNAKRIDLDRIHLVVLCADAQCIDECRLHEDWWCHGIVDSLESGRDVLFIQPGAMVLGDPLPEIVATSHQADLVVLGKSSGAVSGEISSIDQSNTPAMGGLRMQQIEHSRFATYEAFHASDFEQAPLVAAPRCQDNRLYQEYTARTQGYLVSDVLYADPPKLLMLPDMVGTRSDLKQLLKLAITAAKLLNRTLEPPATATFLDVLDKKGDPLVLPVYAAFPLPYLPRALDLSLVEPGYTARAYAHLSAQHPSPAPLAADVEPSQLDSAASSYLTLATLSSPYPLDLTACTSLYDLVRRLSLLAMQQEPVVRLARANDHLHRAAAADGESWREWDAKETFPRGTRLVQPCAKLGPKSGAGGTCETVCRMPASWIAPPLSDADGSAAAADDDEGDRVVREMRRRAGDEPWPALDDYLREGGFPVWT